MPIIDATKFQPVGLYKHGHFNTIVSSVVIRAPKITWQRERLTTPDDDFIDIDTIHRGAKRTIVLCHGLEGSSDSGYIRLLADHFSRAGWDVVAINYRGCSGEMNRQLQMYNSGTTGDLHFIIEHIAKRYDTIVPIGFSLGGNLVLKYLGESVYPIPSQVKSAVAVSTPVDLSNASQQLLKQENKLYQLRFLKTLRKKIHQKKEQFPHDIDTSLLKRCHNLYDFDNFYTAPLFGYTDAEDYYAHCASIQFIPTIERPALLINAKDDPFLGNKCFPRHLANNHFSYCEPQYGGHCGFSTSSTDRSWLPQKIEAYIKEVI